MNAIFIKFRKHFFFMTTFLVISNYLMAEDVVLNPGYIVGGIQVGDVPVDYAIVKAVAGLNTSRVNVRGSEYYNLTVNTTEDGSEIFEVTVSAYTNDYKSQIFFEPRLVQANESQTVEEDFIINPGFVAGKITVNGGTISSANLVARLSGSISGYTNAQTQVSETGIFDFPVQANNGITLSGNVTLNDGSKYMLESITINVTEGQTTIQNFEINKAPDTLGNMYGVLEILGAPVTQYAIRGYSYTDDGVMNKLHVNNLPGGLYSLDMLPGTWNVYADAYLNGSDDLLTLPDFYFKQVVNMSTGSSVNNGMTVSTAFHDGQIVLEGSVNSDAIQQGSLYSYGNPETESAKGVSIDKLDRGGNFDLVLTKGKWSHSLIGLTLTDAESIGAETVNMSILNYAEDHTYSDGEIKYSDINYKTGLLNVNFRNLGSELISSPVLTAHCRKNDDNGDVSYEYTSYVVSSWQQNVIDANVKLIGLEGDCLITARAIVEDSAASFGEFNSHIYNGSEIDTDIGAANLNIASPEPELYTIDSILAVNGLVSSEAGVSSISVNGMLTDFVSTENDYEVEFDQSIMLSEGKNDVSVTVIDNQDKSITETRHVYLDVQDPVLTWSPEDGHLTESISLNVSGKASDDTGVKSILVNGEVIPFNSTSNMMDENEVSFESAIALVKGSNQVSITVIDQAGRMIIDTKNITVIEKNTAPIANAGNDQTIECSGPQTSITVNGEASSDADGDDLEYMWQGDFGSLYGMINQISLPVGIHPINLTVTDSQNSGSDELIATIEDSTPPLINVEAQVSIEATSLNGAYHTLSIAVNDLCSSASYFVLPDIQQYPIGKTTVMINAFDGNLNGSTRFAVINVVDTTKPVLRVPDNMTINATGKLTLVDPGLATADDIFPVSIENNLPESGLTVGTHEILWTARDENGNKAVATQVITVVDNNSPEIKAPDALTVIAQGELTVVDLGNPVVNDETNIIVSHNMPEEGLTVGVHEIIWTAEDEYGNTSTDIQIVKVEFELCDSGFMPPLFNGGRYNNRVDLPVKFKLCFANGEVVLNTDAKLYVYPLSNGVVVGDAVDIASVNNQNLNNEFRLLQNKYMYNLDISSMASGEYRLEIDLGNGSDRKSIDVYLNEGLNNQWKKMNILNRNNL